MLSNQQINASLTSAFDNKANAGIAFTSTDIRSKKLPSWEQGVLELKIADPYCNNMGEFAGNPWKAPIIFFPNGYL